MYGFICNDGSFEWWVRRKEKGKSDVVISRESPYRITEYELDYAVSKYCQCPQVVKEVAKELACKFENASHLK